MCMVSASISQKTSTKFQQTMFTYILYTSWHPVLFVFVCCSGWRFKLLVFSAQRMGFMGSYGIWGYPTCRFASGTCAKTQAIFLMNVPSQKTPRRQGWRFSSSYIIFNPPGDNFCGKPWNFIWYPCISKRASGIRLCKYAMWRFDSSVCNCRLGQWVVSNSLVPNSCSSAAVLQSHPSSCFFFFQVQTEKSEHQISASRDQQ